MLIIVSTDERRHIRNFTAPFIEGEAVPIHAMEIQKDGSIQGDPGGKSIFWEMIISVILSKISHGYESNSELLPP
jgi:hypothetical protein